jgi:hypothetical protein
VTPQAAPPTARPATPAPDPALADAPAEVFAAPATRGGGFGASAEADVAAEEPAADLARAPAPEELAGVDAADLPLVARLDALERLAREPELPAAERSALRERLRREGDLDADQRARLPALFARWKAMTAAERTDLRAKWLQLRAASPPEPQAADPGSP